MTDPIEKPSDLRDTTIEIAKASGLGEVIDEISKVQNLLDFESQSDIPIPTEKIGVTGETLLVSDTLSETLGVLVEMINEEETALEYPFLLTGTATEGNMSLADISLLYSSPQGLQGRVVQVDSQLLGNAVNKAKELGRNIYVIGHTHPKVSGTEKSKTLTSKLSEDVKSKYGIKDVGLNLSLQDLYQLVYFQKALKGNVPEGSKVYLTVLMYDGTLEAISVEDNRFIRTKINYH